MTATDLAAALKAIREETGLSQVAFADAIGVSGPTVSRIEGGLREPDIEAITRWAHGCGRRVRLDFPLIAERDPIGTPTEAMALLSAGASRLSPKSLAALLSIAARMVAAEADLAALRALGGGA